ncbi:MAG: MBL fold metallo-hydrolase [Myxococcaceae bacterium]|nr:MBL fold metallo-hydrolase [Myxococcaceae bacterium]MCI0668828.1 MBL fold metallo-hydrolase [Myxococcaceae bacterium]
MKRLHRKDLYCWSTFNERLNIDFNSFAWVREGGNVLVDPLPLTPHDEEHLRSLGGAAWVVVTNSNHARAARDVAALFGARLAGPAAEQGRFPLQCERWLRDGEELLPGLRAFEMEGSKTPGELALVLEDTTLITGDLIRAHRAGSLMFLLPEQGLEDATAALASTRRLLAPGRIEAVLVGDGWCVFHDGQRRLAELVEAQEAESRRA